MPNRRDKPLYKEAVYGIRNIKTIMEAPNFKPSLWKRLPKNSGMVALFKCCVIMRVRLPRMTHANIEPISALPMPIQVEAMPYFQPNCPAYPTKITAEK